MGAAAIASASLAITASNQARIKNQECQTLVNNFNNTKATTEQKQEYASCINTLYPKYSDFDIMLFKLLFVIALIGLIIGLYKAYKKPLSDFIDYTLFGTIGFFGLPFLTICICGIGVGIYWLFN